MNLLQDDWIPVKVKFTEYKRISLSDVLCTEDCGKVFLPRDDLQFAAVQMCISLVQSIFTPNDDFELIGRYMEPMSRDEYLELSGQFVDMFSVDSPKTPFMQDTRTKDNKTGIQKLLVGLPEGDSATMFVPPDEITKICPSCAAIALYNMASGAPSFGGGFKAPLRKEAPISVLVYDGDLRKMIWKNVIQKSSDWFKLYANAENRPVWKEPIEKDSLVDISKIGVMRGLFWQPARIFLRWEQENGVCDCCGLDSDILCREFDKQKFRYELSGQWIHPHSSLKINKDKKCYVPSFRKETPAWEQLSEIFPEASDGELPPAVVNNYSKFFLTEDIQGIKQKTSLSIGGYINRQASILERHHYLVPLSSSLLLDETGIKKLRLLLGTAIDIKKCLNNSIKNFFMIALNSKNDNNYGFVKKAEKMFFQQSEHIIHEALSSYDDNTLLWIIHELEKVCKPILDETVKPWLGNLRGAKALLKAENILNIGFKEIKTRFR